FFFSSRRRHTRSKRDWSSDVCSSDLRPSPKRSRASVSTSTSLPPTSSVRALRSGMVATTRILSAAPTGETNSAMTARARRGRIRSEERRVGKGGRGGRGGEQEQEERE